MFRPQETDDTSCVPVFSIKQFFASCALRLKRFQLRYSLLTGSLVRPRKMGVRSAHASAAIPETKTLNA